MFYYFACHMNQFFITFIEMCEDYEGKANYTRICCEGAINCTGFVLQPHCECDAANYYIPATDGQSCIPGMACKC